VHFEITGLPSTVGAGVTQAFTVTARDNSNNIVSSYGGAIRFSSTDGAATLPANYAFTAADAGSHTFTPGATFRTLGSQTLTATDISNATITGLKTVAVGPGPATQLTVSGLANPSAAGTAQSLTVTAKDQFGNTATGYTGTIHVSSTDGAATLPVDYTFTAGDSGAHTFAGSVTLKTPGSRSVTATDTASGSITGSQTVSVNPGLATRFTVTGLADPSSATVAQNVTVTALDTVGNVATGYTGTVHFTSSDGSATLPGDYQFTAGDSGVHAFSGGVILRNLGSRSVTATDTANGSINGTQTVTVIPGPATHLVVSGLAEPSTAGDAQTVTVTAKDAFENTATGYTGTVRLTSTDGAASLPANYGFDAGDAGVHAFASGVTLKTSADQTVTATDTAEASITGSQSVTVNAGPLAALVLSPSGSTVESPIPPPPHAMDVVDTNPYPPFALFRAHGFDAYGNDLGDKTSSATFSVSPDGSCDGSLCGDLAFAGGHTVTATIGAVSGTASLIGAHGALSYSCRGENYDVNNNISDGCERLQPLAAHTLVTASFLGSVSCQDADVRTVSGVLYSDSRIHMNPTVTAFDGATGSAPEWYSAHADGGFFCLNDYAVIFTTSGGTATTCYQLTLRTNQLETTMTVSGNGSVSRSSFSSSYADDTTVYFTVEKICGPPVQEAINYTISFHL
jgi:hypothetical protein